MQKQYNKKAIIAVVLGILSLVLTKLSFVGMAIGAIGLGIVLLGVVEIYRDKQKGVIFVVLAIILNAIGTLLPAIVYIIDYIQWMYPDIM